MIVGIVKPDSGKILLDGKDIGELRCTSAPAWDYLPPPGVVDLQEDDGRREHHVHPRNATASRPSRKRGLPFFFRPQDLPPRRQPATTFPVGNGGGLRSPGHL